MTVLPRFVTHFPRPIDAVRPDGQSGNSLRAGKIWSLLRDKSLKAQVHGSISIERQKIIAIHESGHAVADALLFGADTIARVCVRTEACEEKGGFGYVEPLIPSDDTEITLTFM